MINNMSHELDETVTDPDLSAWFSTSGLEVGDLCVRNFGIEYTVPNGSKANTLLGANNYLIQGDWLNASGGLCNYSYSLITDSATTVMKRIGVLGYGFELGLSGTSMTPATTSNGYTYVAFYEMTALRGGASEDWFEVKGFAVDPGQAWLVSVASPGITFSASAASSYTYSAGTATWTWNHIDPSPIGSGATTIVHH